MDDLQTRLDAQAGQARALSEVITALVVSLPAQVLSTAAQHLTVSAAIAREEDDITGTAPAEREAREATMAAFAELLQAASERG